MPRSCVDVEAALRLLRDGELDVLGRLVDASNATLYCTVELDGVRATCVHKPIAANARSGTFLRARCPIARWPPMRSRRRPAGRSSRRR